MPRKSSKSDVKSDGKKEQARELRTLKPTATTTARPDPPPSPAKKQQLVSRQRPAQLVVSCESARAMTRACSRRCAAHLGRSDGDLPLGLLETADGGEAAASLPCEPTTDPPAPLPPRRARRLPNGARLRALQSVKAVYYVLYG